MRFIVDESTKWTNQTSCLHSSMYICAKEVEHETKIIWFFVLSSFFWYYFSFFQPLKSGTTAVCSLIRGQTLYSAWLGDSQSVLVRNGYPVKVVEPHKPNRPVRLYEYWNHNTKYVVLLKKIGRIYYSSKVIWFT